MDMKVKISYKQMNRIQILISAVPLELRDVSKQDQLNFANVQDAPRKI
jgi:hypothetical protein